MYITKNILTLFSKFFKYFVWKFQTDCLNISQKREGSHSIIILYSSLPLGTFVLFLTYKKSGNPSDYLIFYVLGILPIFLVFFKAF
ncbi:hypothetical protein B7709_00775 [Streptococcus oralis subsp. dentisani]|uniref:Uncharacterized protein n=1 Tax=Streptococcus oralis subsp. dentisani TaxID=1458253 RepID=A0A1X1J4J8_STROR|nr:hypothetical protein B7709_00775 [Streptococcus oralis subsp. dentisani]